MKNQYFGDVTDYIKYGILRHFSRTGFQVGVHWALTPDDNSTDGSKTSYLLRHGEWRKYDPAIYDALSIHLHEKCRDVNIVEKQGFIPNAVYCNEVWTNDPSLRMRSLGNFILGLNRSSLVFLDPDNGIATSTVRAGSRVAYKYVFPDEIKFVWDAGHSVVIYQHFPRVERTSYTKDRLLQLTALLGIETASAILTSHVAFLCCLQNHHMREGMEAIEHVTRHWMPATRSITVQKRGDSIDANALYFGS